MDVVDPTPRLVLGAKSGPATDAFSATYSTGEAAGTCGLPEARFFWDGQAVGDPVAIDPTTCSATLDLRRGARAERARQAPGDRTGLRRRQVRDLHAGGRHVHRHCARADGDTEPDTKPDAVAGAFAVGERVTVHPTLTPSPTLVTNADAKCPRLSRRRARPRLPSVTSSRPSSTYVGGPDPGGIDPAVVATNLLLTLLLVFLFALTAEIFNSTMDTHRDEVHGWWLRLRAGRSASSAGDRARGVADAAGRDGRFGSIARVLAVLFLLGFVYSALSPDFGLNTQTLVLFVSLVVGLGFLTYFSEGSTTRLAHSRYRANASVRLYGTAIIVSILAVVVSRLVTFQPGLVYGFVASAVIVAPVALNRRDDATLVLVPALGLIVVSVLAWLLLGPIRVAAAGGALVPGLAETILAMIVIGGLETLFVSMLPLRFMDGATVMGWSRLAWALTFGTVTFLWWQLLLNQDHAYVSAMEQTNVQVVLGTVVVFMLTTGGLWSYFRFRPSRVEAEA